MNKNVTSAGTKVDSSTKDELLPSAPLAASPMLAAVTFRQLLKMWFWKKCCHHKWIVHFEIDVYSNVSRSRGELKIGTEQTLICQQCGKIKKLSL
jgi:hypothetical protein